MSWGLPWRSVRKMDRRCHPTAGSGRDGHPLAWETDKNGGLRWRDLERHFPERGGDVRVEHVLGPGPVSDGDGQRTGLAANSINKTSSASLHVTVGLTPPSSDADPLDAPIALRFGLPSGSQNQTLDCDKNVNFHDEMLSNCQNPYIENVAERQLRRLWPSAIFQNHRSGRFRVTTASSSRPATRPAS